MRYINLRLILAVTIVLGIMLMPPDAAAVSLTRRTRAGEGRQT